MCTCNPWTTPSPLSKGATRLCFLLLEEFPHLVGRLMSRRQTWTTRGFHLMCALASVCQSGRRGVSGLARAKQHPASRHGPCSQYRQDTCRHGGGARPCLSRGEPWVTGIARSQPLLSFFFLPASLGFGSPPYGQRSVVPSLGRRADHMRTRGLNMQHLARSHPTRWWRRPEESWTPALASHTFI